MEWLFSADIEYKGELVTYYFLPVKRGNDTVFRAIPTKEIISPFTMKYDCKDLGFRIVEPYLTEPIMRNEVLFANAIDSLGDLFMINIPFKINLN